FLETIIVCGSGGDIAFVRDDVVDVFARSGTVERAAPEQEVVDRDNARRAGSDVQKRPLLRPVVDDSVVDEIKLVLRPGVPLGAIGNDVRVQRLRTLFDNVSNDV